MEIYSNNNNTATHNCDQAGPTVWRGAQVHVRCSTCCRDTTFLLFLLAFLFLLPGTDAMTVGNASSSTSTLMAGAVVGAAFVAVVATPEVRRKTADAMAYTAGAAMAAARIGGAAAREAANKVNNIQSIEYYRRRCLEQVQRREEDDIARLTGQQRSTMVSRVLAWARRRVSSSLEKGVVAAEDKYVRRNDFTYMLELESLLVEFDTVFNVTHGQGLANQLMIRDGGLAYMTSREVYSTLLARWAMYTASLDDPTVVTPQQRRFMQDLLRDFSRSHRPLPRPLPERGF